MFRYVVQPLLHLLRRLGLAQARTDDREAAEVLDGLRDLLVEVADLVDRRHGDQRGDDRRDHCGRDQDDAGGGAAVPTRPALQRLDQRVQREREQRRDRERRQRARDRADEPDRDREQRDRDGERDRGPGIEIDTVGHRWGRRGSERGRRHIGIVRADGRYGAHAPGAAVGSLRAGARVRARPHVLVPRDRARRRAGDRVGALRDGDRRAGVPGRRVARALPFRAPGRRRAPDRAVAAGHHRVRRLQDRERRVRRDEQPATGRPPARGRAREELRVLPRDQAEGARHEPRRRDPGTPRGRRCVRGDQVGGDAGRGVPGGAHPHDLLRPVRGRVSSTEGSVSSTTRRRAGAPSS